MLDYLAAFVQNNIHSRKIAYLCQRGSNAPEMGDF